MKNLFPSNNIIGTKGVLLTVEPTPLRTPTIVVVRAELTMVHKNIVKLRTIPMISERTSSIKKDSELLCL